MKEIIAKRRKELGLTQQQLAEKLRISDKVVSKWETGRSLPDTSILLPLADALQIPPSELMSGSDTAADVKTAAEHEANTLYKNTCIITMALQLVAAILIIVGRVILDRIDHYESGLSEAWSLVLITLGALCEIAAVTFCLVKRNHLLTRYPTQIACDKKYVNITLFCTYPLVLTVIIVFVALHGLSTSEQLIVLIPAAMIALLPFVLLCLINHKRKP